MASKPKRALYVDASNTGTDPTKEDTDGDGLLDGDEAPRSNPVMADTDSDGYPDGQGNSRWLVSDQCQQHTWFADGDRLLAV